MCLRVIFMWKTRLVLKLSKHGVRQTPLNAHRALLACWGKFPNLNFVLEFFEKITQNCSPETENMITVIHLWSRFQTNYHHQTLCNDGTCHWMQPCGLLTWILIIVSQQHRGKRYITILVSIGWVQCWFIFALEICWQ